MAIPQTRQKKPRAAGAGPRRRRPPRNSATKPIPLKSEVDEPRPQPPADEDEAPRTGRDEAARQEANSSDAEVRDPEPQDDEGRADEGEGPSRRNEER